MDMPVDFNTLIFVIKQVFWAGAVGAGALGYALKEIFKSRDALVQGLTDQLMQSHTALITEKDNHKNAIITLRDAYEDRISQLYAQQVERENRLAAMAKQFVELLAQSIDTISHARREADEDDQDVSKTQ